MAMNGDHRGNLQNEDNLYFIVDDKGNNALSPEAVALPDSMNVMNGGCHRGDHQQAISGRIDMDRLSQWMSRTELLEDENLRLKSDVRKLKKTVRELTNTVQQIMQTLQQQ